MNAAISEITLEIECADAAFAALIERANYSERRALKKERDAVISELKERLSQCLTGKP